MVVESIEMREDGKLSSSELKLVKRLFSKPEVLDSLDRNSLVDFLSALKKEKNQYLDRKNVKKASKEYIQELFDRVISYIDDKITEDDILDYSNADIEERIDEKHYERIDFVYGQDKLTRVESTFEFNKDVNKFKIHDIVAPGLTFRYVAGEKNVNKLQKGEEYVVTWGEEINGKKTYIFMDGPKEGHRCMLLEGDSIKPASGEDQKRVDLLRLERQEEIKKFGHQVGLKSFVGEMQDKYFQNLDRNDRQYGKKYIQKTENILGKKMPENAEPVLESVKQMTEDKFMQGFQNYSPNLQKILRQEFPSIQRAAIAGCERLAKNIGDKFDEKTHLSIYIPNTDRRLSVAINYNGDTGEFTTFPIGYGMRGFGDREGSKETPLGSFAKKSIKISAREYGNLGYTSKSVRGARIDLVGLEKGLNSTTSSRGVLLHGVTKDRESRLSTGEGYTPRSWGCIVAPTHIAREIAETQKGKIVYYEVMPPIS